MDIEFLYLAQKGVKNIGVKMRMAIGAVEDAFRLHAQGKINLPYKTVSISANGNVVVEMRCRGTLVESTMFSVSNGSPGFPRK